MTVQLLSELTSPEFDRSVGPLLSPSILRTVLNRHPLVQQLAEAFHLGTLTEQNLRGFIQSELQQLRRGEPLEHDLGVAALAVALESSPSAFASEFISGLAALGIVEMQLSVLMAKECLKHRRPSPRNAEKAFVVSRELGKGSPQMRVDIGERRDPPSTYFFRDPAGCDVHGAP